MPEERRAIRHALRGRAELVVAGDGAPSAASFARALRSRRVPFVVGAGVAAGLTADLAVGDVVVAANVGDRDLIARCVTAGARRTLLFTVPAPLLSPAEKAALAPSGTAAADMETAGWARAAAAAGVPFVALRAIADASAEGLPDILRSAVGADGRVARWRVAMRLLARPGALGQLLALRSRVTASAARLAPVLDRLLS